MGLDIYVIRRKNEEKTCLIHWRKYGPLADWFAQKIYGGKLDTEEHPLDYLALVYLHENCDAVLQSEDWKTEMQTRLFPVSKDFVWTGYRELAYLRMMNSIIEDLDDVGQPADGEELLIQITY